MNENIKCFWRKDIREIKTKLLIIREVISNSKINPLIQRSVLKDIDRIAGLLRKEKHFKTGFWGKKTEIIQEIVPHE